MYLRSFVCLSIKIVLEKIIFIKTLLIDDHLVINAMTNEN